MTSFTPEEIVETLEMIRVNQLDIRTVTLGIDLRGCAGGKPGTVAERIRRKIRHAARGFVDACRRVEQRYGLPIVNKRLSVTPVSQVAVFDSPEGYVEIAHALDEAAQELGVDFLGGYSALVEKGITDAESCFLDSVPGALAATSRVCGSVNAASTRAGINIDALARCGEMVCEMARRTARQGGLAAAKFVVFANAVSDNPFMAGSFLGPGEGDRVINTGVSGPGVVRAAVESMPADAPLGEIAETVKKLAFKVTRMGELVGRTVSRELGATFGIVDLSLAPTASVGDSVARILEAMGLERCGGPGTTAALALLVDAVKKGGAFASSYVGGLSGAFIPVSEDDGMIRAVQDGALSLDKLEAMTAVCSVGIDMVAVPGDTPPSTLAALMADELAIGVVNGKTTGVRVIPVPGAKPGDTVEFGGLLGYAPVMPISRIGAERFIARGGRIPAPVTGMKN